MTDPRDQGAVDTPNTRRGAAILAAGGSRRLGQPKQLVVYRGEPLVRRVTTLALQAHPGAVAVVLGAERARVAEALDGLTCDRLDNLAWTEGLASSIRMAAAWAEQHELAALLLLLCDQLQITGAHIEQLWHAWTARPDAAVASAYAQTLGIPAIFPRRMYPELLRLQGDRGAAKLLRAAEVTVVPWPDGAHDLDTPEDLERLRSQ